MSRIYWRGRYLDYPLKGTDVIKKLGPVELVRCTLSYMWAAIKPKGREDDLETWVSNRFGKRLYTHFFKSYTEKVWGVPATEVRSEWAAQRIKGLSLGEAVRNALFGKKKNGVVTTLIDEFKYPRHGPGQLWENVTKTITANGWEVRMNSRVVGAKRAGNQVRSITIEQRAGAREEIIASHVFSSMPLRSLGNALDPSPPREILEAANGLKYRDFLTIVLVIDNPDMFPDNWIYIHAPEVRMGRIQNFKSWSPYMVPDQSKTCLGLEYFVNEGDDLWSAPDEQLVKLGYEELQKIGLADGALVKGYVVRMPKAYPVYDTGYQQRLDVIRNWLKTIDNLFCIGRNGQHRYNNQDHSMLTAMMAVWNMMGASHDLWEVNTDFEYHEEQNLEHPEQAVRVP
jgi:protoporphyrinogen oxidase